MRNQWVLKILFPAFIIMCSGVFYQSKAQVVGVSKTDKNSRSHIFANTQKKHALIVRKQNHLPPGQEKKIYGAKSARKFAPGQRKKAYSTNRKYHKRQHHRNKN